MYLRRPERRYLGTNPDVKETRAAEVALARQTPTPEDLVWRREVGERSLRCRPQTADTPCLRLRRACFGAASDVIRAAKRPGD